MAEEESTPKTESTADSPAAGVKRDASSESNASTQLAGVPPSQAAKPEGKSLKDVGLEVQSKVEVLWEVEMSAGADEAVWWSASVAPDPESDEVGATRLVYVPQHGFDEETRRVVFLAGSYLWDCALKERLPYRREGEEGPTLDPSSPEADGADVDEPGSDPTLDDPSNDELPLGCAVKARFQGGRFCAGAIQEVHEDGTYDVLYEDKVLEQNVPRDMIERIAGGDNLSIEEREKGNVAAESSEDFFNLFVTSLTNGPMFAQLSAEQQAVASEKVHAMRPHFDAELAAFRDQRGWGAMVGADDIKQMLPRVMARARGQAAA
jgi:hypothetical protein